MDASFFAAPKDVDLREVPTSSEYGLVEATEPSSPGEQMNRCEVQILMRREASAFAVDGGERATTLDKRSGRKKWNPCK
jgi:hypothetical protein